ncbi:MAG TPA: glycosyltransferase family 2 protein [Steroidobacteraceae bacterium]|nr:glycosyltransferase family 2 protein [Steroidobacteraceae bacterium]
MSVRRPWNLLVAVGVYAVLAGWIVLAAADLGAGEFSFLIYGLANIVVFTDAVDFAVRLWAHRRHTAASAERGAAESRVLSIDLPDLASPALGRARARPYAIVASVFNLEDGLDDFMARLAPHREHVWLISDGSTDHTAQRLRQAGWRCLEEDVNRRKPGALRRLLSTLPARIETVMVIDPDVRICSRGEGSDSDLERVVADLQQSGAAAVCPRVTLDRDGILARFQTLEYALTCVVGRRSMADFCVTSGVSIYRRDALEHALERHSLSVYAEDFETALILLNDGERIYYDGRLVVSAEGPRTLRHWFSQRVGWHYGLVRVYTERFRELWRIGRRDPFAMYNFVGYLGVLGFGLHALKLLSAALISVSVAGVLDNLFSFHLLPYAGAVNPAYFVGASVSYLALGTLVLLTVVPQSDRRYIAPILPIYFLYVLLHLAPITVGFGNWVTLRLWRRRLFRDHYQSHEDLPATYGALYQP